MGEILWSVTGVISQNWIMFHPIVATILNFLEILGGRFAAKFQMTFKTEVKTKSNPILRNCPVLSFQPFFRLKNILIIL